VTEPGDVLLDRVQLERAFTALGERMVRRGVVADVFVVGGAAMALAYDATRVTRDVDSLFVPHGVVLEEARNVAQDLGLPAWWLNEQASVYISGKDDPGRRRVFDHPGLRVSRRAERTLGKLCISHQGRYHRAPREGSQEHRQGRRRPPAPHPGLLRNAQRADPLLGQARRATHGSTGQGSMTGRWPRLARARGRRSFCPAAIWRRGRPRD
jgi:hypothetical protein